VTAIRTIRLLTPALLLAALAAGCQQKMAEQPYYRPYESSEFYKDDDHRSNRPLDPHAIHRAQPLENDALATGWTEDEWKRMWAKGAEPVKPTVVQLNQLMDRAVAFGAPRYDQRKEGEPKVYVEAFPFEITPKDLRIGAERYSIYCVECHGPMGNGKGKIWERGYLKPTSYHTHKIEPYEPDESGEVLLGFSRGYWRWGIQIPLREVPPGYIFTVISQGYGGMADYAAQIKPADRWRIAAYVRALQFSQNAEYKDLPEEIKKQIDAGATKTEGGTHEH